MTARDWEIVAVIVCISVVVGFVLGVRIQCVAKLLVAWIVMTALILLSTLGYRFGGPAMWPWQDTILQNALAFGALVLVIAAPVIGAAGLSRWWVMRRKVI